MASWLERAWVERYLERQLTGEEKTWFESYLIDKPELLEIVDTDTRLREVLFSDPGQWKQTGSYAKRIDVATSRKKERMPRWMSVAASLAIGLGIGCAGEQVYLQRMADHREVSSVLPIRYEISRGGGQSAQIEPQRVHAGTISDSVENDSLDAVIEVGLSESAHDVMLQIGDVRIPGVMPSNEPYVTFLVSRSTINRNDHATISFQSEGEQFLYELVLPSPDGRKRR